MLTLYDLKQQQMDYAKADQREQDRVRELEAENELLKARVAELQFRVTKQAENAWANTDKLVGLSS